MHKRIKTVRYLVCKDFYCNIRKIVQYANNILTDSIYRVSKIIKSGVSFGYVRKHKDNLPGLLVSNLTSNATNKFERKIRGKGAVKAGGRFT